MARSSAAWGIDVGQCSLKAIRCRQGDAPGRLVAEAFDYIAYPKILSQPGSDPAELIGEALKHFLSRNTVRGDRVAISVPGQSGLARFIKLPPVEAKKIPDIVRYEARQQIPFDLADVVWDYQRMGGGAEEEGFALETEVGLFAMKRDQVYRALEPFTKLGVQVDIVQLTPLALYNFLLFDQMPELPPVDQYDPDDPPPSTVVLSLGTDATDLVVTNGYRVWQRSIPLGGNHFTKALTKELKLTFAKAEHLKCNAAAAPDPRALFQAMRPVFNDLLTEIQRSIGYFTSIDRRAKIEKIVTLGNGMKMPGLRRYLSQSLGVDVIRLEAFDHLTGAEVMGAPAFKENLLSFPVAYGLAVQALKVGRGTLRTNLLPREIVKDRFIRGKKPWALAGAALLLLGCAIGYGNYSLALNTVAEERFKPAEEQISALVSKSQRLCQEEEAAKSAFQTAYGTAGHLVDNVDHRVLWLELFRAMDEALPASDPPDKRPKDLRQWKELHIESIDCQRVADLATWYAGIKDLYRAPGSPAPEAAAGGAQPTAPAAGAAPPLGPAGTGPAAPVGGAGTLPGGLPPDVGAGPAMLGTDGATAQDGPQGPGWVIRLSGYHFHNPEATTGEVGGAQYVHDTLIRNLEGNEIFLPSVEKEGIANGAQQEEKKQDLVSMKELGIGYPTLTVADKIRLMPMKDPIADESDASKPAASGAGKTAGIGGMGPAAGLVAGSKDEKVIQVPRFNFVVEFCWVPTSPTARLEKHKQAHRQAADPLGQMGQEPK